MFYFGAIVGAAVGFLTSVAFPGVVAYLRAGYFAKVHQLAGYAQQEAKKL